VSDANPWAPGALDRIRELINTRFIERGTDAVATPAALEEWLRERDLLPSGEALGVADVAELQAAREALRELAALNHGAPLGEDARAVLARIGARAHAAFACAEDGALVLQPVDHGIAGVLARLLAIVYDAQREGTWPRFHVCARATCRWAFYDHTKNRSAQWCEMSICGNREKARRRRSRARAA
jgi:predicted RNA-binding Zn ribbon-like protein